MSGESSHHKNASLSNYLYTWDKWKNKKHKQRNGETHRKYKEDKWMSELKDEISKIKKKTHWWVQQQNGGDRGKNHETEYRTTDITQSEKSERKQTGKNDQIFRDLWDYNKRSSVHVIGVWEAEEKQSGDEKLLKKYRLITS